MVKDRGAGQAGYVCYVSLPPLVLDLGHPVKSNLK